MEYSPSRNGGIQWEKIRKIAKGCRIQEDGVLFDATDLVVIGNHGRNVLFEMLIGSTATQILQDIDSDVLVVPERLSEAD